MVLFLGSGPKQGKFGCVYFSSTHTYSVEKGHQQAAKFMASLISWGWNFRPRKLSKPDKKLLTKIYKEASQTGLK